MPKSGPNKVPRTSVMTAPPGQKQHRGYRIDHDNNQRPRRPGTFHLGLHCGSIEAVTPHHSRANDGQ